MVCALQTVAFVRIPYEYHSSQLSSKSCLSYSGSNYLIIREIVTIIFYYGFYAFTYLFSRTITIPALVVKAMAQYSVPS